MLVYPVIDPVALRLGPFVIRWYSLAYIAGIVLGWLYVRWMHRRLPIPNLTPKAFDDLMLWAVLGIVGGGRLGYVLFYKPGYYLAHPLEIFTLWEGGMSFHGGLLGVLLALAWFARRYGIPYLALMDAVAAAAPIGLFLGRLANFINGELYGRVADAPWGMIFPHGGELPRHPSQLYEAALEGIMLFVLLFVLVRFTQLRRYPGCIGGIFLIGYGLARATVEMFREPDAHLGLLLGTFTMGQLLCAPMIVFGVWLIARSLRRPPLPAI